MDHRSHKRKFSAFKSVLSVLCAVSLGATVIPISSAAAAEETIYYFSIDGSDSDDGLSPESPKKSLSLIPELLQPGTTVLLKRGDAWYEKGLYLDFADKTGTADEPITISSYGEAEEAPVIADMTLFTAADWTAVESETGDLWKTDFAFDTKRVYLDGALTVSSDSASDMEENTYYLDDENDLLYLKAQTLPEKTEIISAASNPLIHYENSSYITLKDLSIKGGGYWTALLGEAPTEGLQFDNLSVSQISQYGMQMMHGSDQNAVHESIRIENCYFDRGWSQAFYDKNKNALTADGICLRNAVNNAIVRGTTVLNFGHTGINCEVLNSGYPGVMNCIIEDNVISAEESPYLRAFEFKGFAGTCQNNIFRRNYCYTLTNSSHCLGENNKIYGNIFSGITATTADTTTIQPYAIDMIPWSDAEGTYVSEGNIIANNTFYDTVNAIRVDGMTVKQNTIVNNLIVGWNPASSGLLIQNFGQPQIVKNNGFWNQSATDACITEGKTVMTADAANELVNFSDNIQADPCFVQAEQDNFTLSETSPYRYAGLPIADQMDEGFTDFYGNTFDPAAPSIGAISYIKGLISRDNRKSVLVTDLLNTYGLGDYIVSVDAMGSGSAKLTAALNGVQVAETEEVALSADSFTTVSGKISLNWDTLTLGALAFSGSATLRNWSLSKCAAIAEVAAVKNYVVRTGTTQEAIGLPKTLQVTLETNETVMLPIQWNGTYDGNTPGKYTLTGTLVLPADISGNWQTPITTEISVQDQLNITLIPEVQKISVAYDTAKEKAIAKLPAQLSVQIEDNSYVSLSIQWDTADSFTEPGAYRFIGTPVLTEGVSNGLQLSAETEVTILPDTYQGVELLQNSDFEDGTVGWTAAYSLARGGKLEVIANDVVNGEGAIACITTQKKQAWDSAVQDVTEAVKTNGHGAYYVQAYIKSLSGQEQTGVRILIQITDSNGKRNLYSDPVTISPEHYTKLSDILNVSWSGELKKVDFAVLERGGGITGDVAIDSTSFRCLELLKNAGFEEGISEWKPVPWAGTLNTVDTAEDIHTEKPFYAGSAAICRMDPKAWNGPVQDITRTIEKFGPGTYQLSGWAKTINGAADQLQWKLRFKLKDKGEVYYTTDFVAVNSDAYTLCTGKVTIPAWSGELEDVYFCPQTKANIAPLYFDDCSMIYLNDPSSLKALIESLQNTDLSGYTQMSIDAFKTALQTAKLLADHPAALQAQLDRAAASLELAAESLQQQPEEPVIEWVLGWHRQNGEWTYRLSNGRLQKGWMQGRQNEWYFFDRNGIMQTGWLKDTDGKWYYLSDSGAMKIGWLKDTDGKWYYLGSDGVMKIGWLKDTDGKWYYLSDSGAMKTGWLKDTDGKWYYLKQNGEMAVQTMTPNGYFVGADGQWIPAL